MNLFLFLPSTILVYQEIEENYQRQCIKHLFFKIVCLNLLYLIKEVSMLDFTTQYYNKIIQYTVVIPGILLCQSQCSPKKNNFILTTMIFGRFNFYSFVLTIQCFIVRHSFYCERKRVPHYIFSVFLTKGNIILQQFSKALLVILIFLQEIHKMTLDTLFIGQFKCQCSFVCILWYLPKR